MRERIGKIPLSIKKRMPSAFRSQGMRFQNLFYRNKAAGDSQASG